MSACRPAASTSSRVSLEPVDPPGAEHDVGAGLGERLRERHAEAGGGAGHDRDLAVEAEQVQDGHRRCRPVVALRGVLSGWRLRASQALRTIVVDVVAHLPVEVAGRELAVGDDPGRVAGAARVRPRG